MVHDEVLQLEVSLGRLQVTVGSNSDSHLEATYSSYHVTQLTSDQRWSS